MLHEHPRQFTFLAETLTEVMLTNGTCTLLFFMAYVVNRAQMGLADRHQPEPTKMLAMRGEKMICLANVRGSGRSLGSGVTSGAESDA
ncbi:hypothetical protein [Cryobacterium frigoriphilum]|uniref:hypothetical protein n=1 Tax=Cryobacterium frigoriphilum TaxID=1259150 RepID=UPI001F53F1EB|nr:hypothetical protein [Cryobacterium frigoriphilum]